MGIGKYDEPIRMLAESPEKNTPRLAGQICRSLIHLGLLSRKPEWLALVGPFFGGFLPRLNFRGGLVQEWLPRTWHHQPRRR